MFSMKLGYALAVDDERGGCFGGRRGRANGITFPGSIIWRSGEGTVTLTGRVRVASCTICGIAIWGVGCAPHVHDARDCIGAPHSIFLWPVCWVWRIGHIRLEQQQHCDAGKLAAVSMLIGVARSAANINNARTRCIIPRLICRDVMI